MGKKFGTYSIKNDSEIINKAFEILRKYNLLIDEELFRYIEHNNGKKLKDLPPIQDEDLNALYDAIYKVRETYLQVLHVKKGFSL